MEISIDSNGVIRSSWVKETKNLDFVLYLHLGQIYKNQSAQSSNPITLLLSTDGKPTIKFNKSSLWPVSTLS